MKLTRRFFLGTFVFVAALTGGFFMGGDSASAGLTQKNCSRCASDYGLTPDGLCNFGQPTGGKGCFGSCFEHMGQVRCSCTEFGVCNSVIRL
jgi:hypothetical protein